MLSIDVGSKKVCVVEGKNQGNSVTISSCGEIVYENEVVVNDEITDRPALSFMINEIIKTKRMKSKSAVVTLNSDDIISREFKLPKVKLSSLKQIVNNEMLRIIRDDKGYITDFIVTGTTEDNMLSVKAYAAPKSLVESYFALLKELKLKPYALDFAENSVSKLFSSTPVNGETYDDSNMIVINVGYSKVFFHGFTRGKSNFYRMDVSPVQEFYKEVESLKGINAANSFVTELTFSPDHDYDNPVISEASASFVYALTGLIRKHIQYFIINSDIKSIKKIYVCGGIISASGLEKALTEQIKIPVEQVRQVGRLTVPEDISLSKICIAAGSLIRR